LLTARLLFGNLMRERTGGQLQSSIHITKQGVGLIILGNIQAFLRGCHGQAAHTHLAQEVVVGFVHIHFGLRRRLQVRNPPLARFGCRFVT
jgi:hypothetical protein